MSSIRKTVALGEFDVLVDIGLRQLLGADKQLRLVNFDLDSYYHERSAWRHIPAVIVLDEARVCDLSRLTQLKSSHPHTAIVLLAYRDSQRLQARARLVGVRYLSQGASADEIVSMIHMAAEGKNSPRIAALTARESEVMVHLVAGESHREIAEKLHIGVETVRTHSTRIRRKLGLRKKHELIGLPLPQQSM